MNLVTALRKGCFAIIMLLLSMPFVGRSYAATSFSIVPNSSELNFNTRAGVADTQSITINNLTSYPLTLYTTVTGSGSSMFNAGTTPVIIAGNGSTTAKIVYSPMVAGTNNATLTIYSLAGDSATIALMGHATSNTSSSFSLTPSSGQLVFNTHTGTAAVDTLSIRNLTSNPLSFTVTSSGSPLFTLGSNSLNVGANGTGNIVVTYLPVLPGTNNGTLMVRASNGDTASVSLTGHAVLPNSNAINVAGEVDFSAQAGQSECLPISIGNMSAGGVSISNVMIKGDSTAFSAANNGSFQINSLGSGTVTVCFNPSVNTHDETHATLSFNYASLLDSTIHGVENVQLEGKVEERENEGDSLFFLTTQNLEFNNVLVGTTQCEAVRISNPTGTTVVIDSSSINGIGSSFFTVSGANNLTVGAHSTQYINVCFAPTSAVNSSNNQNTTITLYDSSALGRGTLMIHVEANAIDSANNNGELTNCLMVRHEHGVLGPIISGGTDTSAIFITNRTNSNLTINSATVSGTNSNAFTVTSQFPMTLSAGQQGQLMVAFNPTSITGAPSYGATITLNTSGGNMTCGPITIHVEGVAVPGFRGDHDTSDIDLGTGLTGNGTTVIGITKPTTTACVIDTLSFMNTTSNSITVGQIVIPSSQNFTLLGTSMNLPATVNAGGTLTAMVQFCSQDPPGTVTTSPLFVSTNQSIQPQTFQLQAIAAAPLAVSNDNEPSPINFAVMPNPSSGEVRIEVDNARSVTTQIYDLLGNLIKSENGSQVVVWNGEDGSGNQVSNGVYIVRVSGSDAQGQSFKASKQILIQR